ncbi:MAG: ribosome maturation factor RimP [Geminicoccaceae bacterium]
MGPRPTLYWLDRKNTIADLIEPTLHAMGYELVRVMNTGGRRPTLQVMAERLDRAGMTVDHCAEISRAVSAILDVEDPIAGAYELEVSSPGIDRPLVKPADFERFAGFEARVETDRQIEGQRKFKGQLLGLKDEAVRLVLPDGEREIPFEAIRKAKLVLTDELLAAAEAEGRN